MLALATTSQGAELPSARGGNGATVASVPEVTRGGPRGQPGEMAPLTFCNNLYRGGGGGGANAAGGAGRHCASAGAAGGLPGDMAVAQGRGGDGGIGGLDGTSDYRSAGGGGGGASCFVGNAADFAEAASCTGGDGGNGGDGRTWLAPGAGGGGGDGAELHGQGAASLSWSGQLVGGAGGRPGHWPLGGFFLPDDAVFARSGSGGAGVFVTGALDGATFAGTAQGGAGGSAVQAPFGGSNGAPGPSGAAGCTNGGAGSHATTHLDLMPSPGAAGGSGIELAEGARLTQAGAASGGSGGSAGPAAPGFVGGTGGRGGNGMDGTPPGSGCAGGPAGAGSRGADGSSAGPGGAGAVLTPDTALVNHSALVGGAGGAGSPGGAGGAGGTGGAGGDGGYGTVAGFPARGNGGSGHHGGTGGSGGHGGHGGAGGAGVLLLGGADLRNEFIAGVADGRIEGGMGGNAGAPGAGGGGGAGGPGGSSANSGVPGGSGGPGVAGTPGFSGVPGAGGAGVVASPGDQVDNAGGVIAGGVGGASASGGSEPVLGAGGAGGAGVVLDGAHLLSTRGAIMGGNGSPAGTSGLAHTVVPGGRGGLGGDGVRASGEAMVTIAGSATFVAAVAGGTGAPGRDDAGGGDREGGAGGAGIVLTGTASLGTGADATSAIVVGGAGGEGGSAFDMWVDRGGHGGRGGDGVRLAPGTAFEDGGGSSLAGGAGGAGGTGAYFHPAGRGADGGTALRIDAAASARAAATSTYRGGDGGAGGACGSASGRGQTGSRAGAGGAAVVVASSRLEFDAAALGGAGGIGASSPTPCLHPPEHGAGGAGLVLAGAATVVLSGSASGGLRGGSSAEGDRAPAVLLQGGGNVLEVHAGFVLTGRAQSTSGTAHGGDVLVLGGAGLADTFDLARLGEAAQFRGFQQLRKSGGGLWRLTGSSPFAGATRIEQGVLDLRGSLAGSAITVAGGSLAGAGTAGPVDNAARVSPGFVVFSYSAGTLATAAYVQQPSGVLAMEVLTDTHDRLVVDGTAQLAGTLAVTFLEVPVVGERYSLLSAGSLAGTFDTLSLTHAGGQPLPPAMLDYGATTPGTVTLSFFDLVLSTSVGTASYQQAPSGAAAPVAVDPGLLLTGSEVPERATVAIADGLHAGEDRLAFVNDDPLQYGNITASVDVAAGSLALESAGATATLAHWQAALRAVTYANLAEMPVLLSAGTRKVRFQVGRASFTTPERLRDVVVRDARTPQALSFAAQEPSRRVLVPGAAFGLAPPATTSSGLAPTYTAAPVEVCSIYGETVTMAGPGECVITAAQEGNGAFAPATPQVQSVTLYSDRVQAGTLPPLADAEGHGGTRRISLPLVLDAARPDDVTLAYAISALDAFGVPAQDFVAPTGLLTFPPGATQAVLDLDLVADTMVEPEERFLLSLTPISPGEDGTGVNATLGASLAAGLELSIANDDTAVLSLSSPTATEGEGVLGFTASLDAPVQGGLALAYATLDGAAQAGLDYQPAAGGLAHDGSVTAGFPLVTVLLIDDVRDEPAEDLLLDVQVQCAFDCSSEVEVAGGVGEVQDDDAPGLSIAIDNGTNASDPQDLVPYRIVVTNHGSAAATGVEVAAVLPQEAELLDWDCSAPAGGHCSPGSGIAGELSVVDLPAGSAATLIAQVLLGEFDHYVSVGALLVVPPGVDDPEVADNSDTDTDLRRTLFKDGFD